MEPQCDCRTVYDSYGKCLSRQDCEVCRKWVGEMLRRIEQAETLYQIELDLHAPR